ncbi:MAG TPA: phytoene/squalene synthase family protein [Verrucomicrobiae bacterium]
MEYRSDELLTRLLRDVSRSFYLTLRVLPPPVRPQIGLAYLLARTTDTIADTEIIPLEQRLAALSALRARILGETNELPALGELSSKQGNPAEQILLQRIPEAVHLLDQTPGEDKKLIREVLDTITSGQVLDLNRFAGAGKNKLVALQTDATLDDYTYRVAGCVGEFWTKICRRHLFPQAKIDDAWLLAEGIRYGKGLQLINILRDLPRDLRQGRCYMPAETLAKHGLTKEDLLKPETEAKFRPLYNSYLSLATEHLAAGWNYTLALPKGCVRVRLACAWPILIGARTLRKLESETILNPQHRVKVSRTEVWTDVLGSIALYPTPWWSRLVRLKLLNEPK